VELFQHLLGEQGGAAAVQLGMPMEKNVWLSLTRHLALQLIQLEMYMLQITVIIVFVK
jgi:hypothetical protein